MKKKVKKPKTIICDISSKLVLPPVPIGHLKVTEFSELRQAIERITGYKIVMTMVDKLTGKSYGEI